MNYLPKFLRRAIRRLYDRVIFNPIRIEFELQLQGQARAFQEEIEALYGELVNVNSRMIQRMGIQVPKPQHMGDIPKCEPIHPKPFDDYLADLEALQPGVFPLWRRAFDAALDLYAQDATANCSVNGHQMAPLFELFVRPYLRGHVLDVGCGPQAKPLHLAQYPDHLISGIDPLPPFEQHPFEYVRGFAEFLPWEDNTFDVVITSTSLDHVLSLTQALTEIRRVLRPEGYYLIWDGFIAGSPPYDPDRPNFVPVDEFHLFHFDKPWFEETMSAFFTIAEVMKIDSQTYFYALQPLK